MKDKANVSQTSAPLLAGRKAIIPLAVLLLFGFGGGPLFAPPSLLLTITSSSNKVTVSWPYALPGFVLQQSTNLSPASWIDSSLPITTNGYTQSVTITAPSGNLFFRLLRPAP